MKILVDMDGQIVEVKDERIEMLVREYLERQKGERKEYEFTFEATNDPRKGYPYVARLGVKDGKLDREFYDLERFYGKKSVTVKGNFRAKEGDILEIQEGGSWKNKYRSLYIVKDGELVLLGDASNSQLKGRIYDYLVGKKTTVEVRR